MDWDLEIQEKALMGLNTEIIKLHLNCKRLLFLLSREDDYEQQQNGETSSHSFAKVRMGRNQEGKQMIVTFRSKGGK